MRRLRVWKLVLVVVAVTTFVNGCLVYWVNYQRDEEEQAAHADDFLSGDKKRKPLNHIEVSRMIQRFGNCEFLGTLDGKRTIGVFDCKGVVTMEFLNE